MIQLLDGAGTGVGPVGGVGRQSPMMPPDSPVKSNSSFSVAGVTPPNVKIRLWL